MSTIPIFIKDPDDNLDYSIDWSSWLDDDTISSSAWLFSGVEQGDSANTNTTTSTTVWVKGGTVGRNGTARNRIVTAGGRQKDQTLAFPIREK